MSDLENLQFQASASRGAVSAIRLRPAAATSLLVLGHGAGAGMSHPFLASLARRLADRGMATLRYQFPYMEAGKRAPDAAAVLEETVRSAVATACREDGDLPLFAGGKSMGGRMTSRAAARENLPGVHGLIFFGFPLHPAGKPGRERAEHLSRVARPMLFLQGTRDRLADLDLLRPVVRRLEPRAELHVVDGGDHSFGMLKRSGRSQEQAIEELARVATGWAARVLNPAER